MLSGAVTNRYTLALYRVAEKHGVSEKVDQSLQLVAEVLRKDTRFKSFLENPVIDIRDKMAILRQSFADALEPYVYRFIQLLLHRKRVIYFLDMTHRFHQYCETAAGYVTVIVETAQALTEEQDAELKQKLNALVGKSVHLKVHVNPSLLGGYRAQVGNRILDATLVRAVAQFGEKLLQRA